MKMLRKRKGKKTVKKFISLQMYELIQIRGGDGDPTQIDIDFPR